MTGPGPRRSRLIRICAWCDRFMGTVPPLDDQSLTHGICPDCLERLAWEERQIRGRAQIIVRRDWSDLRDRLEAIYAGFEDVVVRLDRRTGERRQAGPYSGLERRRSDRRRPLMPSQAAAWTVLGHFVAW